VQMWLDGGKYNGRQVLDPKTIRAAQTPITQIGVSPVSEGWGIHFRTYGLGWTIYDYGGKKIVEHNGGMPGYISKVALVPEANLGFVILNNGNDGSINDAIRFKLLDHFMAHVGQDWDKVFKNFADMGAAGQAAETEARAHARVPNTQPSVAQAAYVGTYNDRTYGDVKVSNQDGGLFFSMEPSKELFSGKMEHFHYDTWKVQFNDPYLPFALVSFQIGPKAEVQGLKIDLPNGDFHFWQLDFKRKAG
jgi:CubicO group peptidase (beta-lactamase class C family)